MSAGARRRGHPVKLYPAIDILGGNAVRLVRGDFDAKKVYDEDPLSAARGWVAAGAEYLHVVDLDGAKRGEPVNLEHARRIAADVGRAGTVGGGLRTAHAVAAALDAGAARVILGTVAFTDPDVARRGPRRARSRADPRRRRRARRRLGDARLAADDRHAGPRRVRRPARARRAQLRVHQHRPRRDARRGQPRGGRVGREGGGGGERDLLRRDRRARGPRGARELAQRARPRRARRRDRRHGPV